MVGQRFGRLTVVAPGETHTFPCGKRRRRWLCQCDCGGTATPFTADLRSGNTTSCGCRRQEALAPWHAERHGHAAKGHITQAYRTWQNMKDRCFNPTNVAHDGYGGRGITVCERWLAFENFLADMGEPPPDPPGWEGERRCYSLERVDNDGNYEPGNCRWATATEQRANRRDSR